MFYSRELTQRINLYCTNGNILDNNERKHGAKAGRQERWSKIGNVGYHGRGYIEELCAFEEKNGGGQDQIRTLKCVGRYALWRG